MNAVFTFNNIIKSLGKMLNEEFKVNVYINPQLQNTKLPCFFINTIGNAPISGCISNRFMYEQQIAITYIEERNKTNLYEIYNDIALRVIELLDTLYYNDDYENTFTLGIHNKNINNTLENLLITCTIKARLKKDIQKEKIKNIELKVKPKYNNDVIKEYKMSIKKNKNNKQDFNDTILPTSSIINNKEFSKYNKHILKTLLNKKEYSINEARKIVYSYFNN